MAKCITSAFRHLCILYSSCDTVITSCSDCHTSPADCQVCSFEDTLPDGSCASSTSTELPCTSCVSGPALCSCSSEGECQAEDDNVVDQFSGVALEQECAALCLENNLCEFFTYFGDNSGLR